MFAQLNHRTKTKVLSNAIGDEIEAEGLLDRFVPQISIKSSI